VIHKENGGLVSARAAGLEYAHGQYCGFVDGDDWIEHNLYSEMLLMIQSGDYDFIHCNYIQNQDKNVNNICTEREVIFDDLESRITVLQKNVFGRDEFSNYITPSVWTKLYRMEFIRKCYLLVPLEQSYGEDLVCLFHAVMQAKAMKLCLGHYYHYRILEGSMSHNFGLNDLAGCSSLYTALKKISADYGLDDRVNHCIDQHYWSGVLRNLKYLENDSFHMRLYSFPCEEMLRGKRIVLYGAGKVGNAFYEQLRLYRDIHIVAWVDKNADEVPSIYYKINRPSSITGMEYDYIVIAVQQEKIAKEIVKELQELRVEEKKIIWKSPKVGSLL
jgi:glycosyltransferase involved in cell wall biosynthesis